MNFSTLLACRRALLLRGAAWTCAGVLAVVLTLASSVPLVAVVAPFALLDGATALFTAVRDVSDDGFGRVLIADGIAALVGAAVALTPGVPPGDGVPAVVALPAVLSGTAQLMVSRVLVRSLPGEWLPAAAGAGRLGFGLLLLATPAGGLATAVAVLTCLCGGVGMVLVALRFRALCRPSRRGAVTRGAGAPAAAERVPEVALRVYDGARR